MKKLLGLALLPVLAQTPQAGEPMPISDGEFAQTISASLRAAAGLKADSARTFPAQRAESAPDGQAPKKPRDISFEGGLQAGYPVFVAGRGTVYFKDRSVGLSGEVTPPTFMTGVGGGVNLSLPARTGWNFVYLNTRFYRYRQLLDDDDKDAHWMAGYGTGFRIAKSDKSAFFVELGQARYHSKEYRYDYPGPVPGPGRGAVEPVRTGPHDVTRTGPYVIGGYVRTFNRKQSQ